MEVMTKNSESLLGVQSGVANMSRKRESRMGVAKRVANVNHESESRVESQNVGRECGSRM